MIDEARGGYVLAEAEACGGEPQTVLIAAVGETAVALEARDILERDGIGTRVVCLPRPERFAAQDRAYRDRVLAPHVTARVSVAAGAALGWYAMVGGAGDAVGLERFGADGPFRRLYGQYGLTADRVAAAARHSLARSRARSRARSPRTR
ncbi:transketolase-like TK C-terminal-containing protein [Streptomyces sp. NPDC086023]|uniref:transketolase-like TK C-terminal-containing protein n=1 Tax=unclassified Streptomyces TaxID=2593676 RepID=UPI0037D961A0